MGLNYLKGIFSNDEEDSMETEEFGLVKERQKIKKEAKGILNKIDNGADKSEIDFERLDELAEKAKSLRDFEE